MKVSRYLYSPIIFLETKLSGPLIHTIKYFEIVVSTSRT